MRSTPHRTEILTLLQQTEGALSANLIHETLPHIDLVTIYRTLDLFVREDLIKKLYLGDSEATFEYQNQPHFHAVCDTCERVVHFDVATDMLIKHLSVPHFTIKNIELILRGTCTHAHSTTGRLP